MKRRSQFRHAAFTALAAISLGLAGTLEAGCANQSPPPDAKQAPQQEVSGMYELFRYPGLDVIAVSGVGGGSHGWVGMLVPPQAPGYDFDGDSTERSTQRAFESHLLKVART